MSPPTQRRATDSGGMSLGEVARLIEALRADNTVRFDKLDARLDTFDVTYVRRETYSADARAKDLYTAGLETRVAKIEGTLQWVLRTAGGAIIIGVIGLFFAASKWV